MNRYILSFFMASAVYISVLSLIFYQSITDDSHKKSEDEKISRVCISVVKEQIPMKKIDPKVEQKTETKIEKQIVKKAIEQKIEKVETSKLATAQPSIERAQETLHVKQNTEEKEVKTEKKQKESEQKSESLKSKKADEETLKAKQNRFIAELMSKINTNKSYPRIARNDGIEGDVKVQFYITYDGNVDRLKLVCGEKIFERSAFEAIKKSFPMKVNETLFHFPKEFTVTLAYVLK